MRGLPHQAFLIYVQIDFKAGSREVNSMATIRLSLDPWPSEYESAFQVEGLAEESPQIDTGVEGVGWRSVDAVSRGRVGSICFIDGVRRVEARIIIDDSSGRIIRGLFGSAAVGAVRVEGNESSFAEVRVKRVIVGGTGILPEPELLEVGNSHLLFEPLSVSDNTPQGPLAGLQNLMRTEEASLGEALVSTADCVFADGPLTYFSGVMHTTVGVIKRLVEPYLAAPQFDLVRRLRVGQRTPLFVISQGKYDRYSWYLRVGKPRTMDHEVAGVLRLEVRTGAGLEKGRELADMSAACLPSFAGEAFRDPRSPQNLLPIGALENELRHRLGDALTIRRAIEARLFEMSPA